MENKILKVIKIIFISVTVITIITFWFVLALVYFEYNESCFSDDNIAIIKMHGEINLVDGEERWVTSVDPIVDVIEELSSNDNIEVIILDIYSPGGTITAGEEVMNALKRSPKKTIALIREMGTSSAYLAATGADEIYATEFSEIGNIGITMSYLDYTEKNIQEGVEFIDLSSAEFKDMFRQGKSLTEEEREKITSFISELHDIMVDKIAENRNMPIEEVREVADGSIFSARKAKDNNLIDYSGGFYEIFESLSDSGLEANPCHINLRY